MFKVANKEQNNKPVKQPALGDCGMPVELLPEASYTTVNRQLAVGGRLYLCSME